jgi:cytochrome c-type biogenesis protein CcmF
MFLAVVIGGALLLVVFRASRVSEGGANDLFSRETLLLVNNVLLVVASASVLLGTLYPLLIDALELGKISVGPPWFEAVFAPLMLLLAFLVGLGPMVRWKSDRLSRHARRLWPWLLACIVLALLWVYMRPSPRWWITACGISMALWIMVTTIIGVADRLRSARGEGAMRRRLRPAFMGMSIAHLGFAVTVLGLAGVSAWDKHTDLRMQVGGQYQYSGYSFKFGAVEHIKGPNYDAQRGHVEVSRDGQVTAVLTPEKRVYRARGQAMTEASIDATLERDIFIALGEPLGDGSWAVRVQVKPLIRLIWLGPLIMAIGGLLAMSDRRYRVRARPATESLPLQVPQAVAAPVLDAGMVGSRVTDAPS